MAAEPEQWLVRIRGQQIGPLGTSDLEQLVADQTLRAEDELSPDGIHWGSALAYWPELSPRSAPFPNPLDRESPWPWVIAGLAVVLGGLLMLTLVLLALAIAESTRAASKTSAVVPEPFATGEPFPGGRGETRSGISVFGAADFKSTA